MTGNLWIAAALIGALFILAGVLTGGAWLDRRMQERQDE